MYPTDVANILLETGGFTLSAVTCQGNSIIVWTLIKWDKTEWLKTKASTMPNCVFHGYVSIFSLFCQLLMPEKSEYTFTITVKIATAIERMEKNHRKSRCWCSCPRPSFVLVAFLAFLFIWGHTFHSLMVSSAAAEATVLPSGDTYSESNNYQVWIKLNSSFVTYGKFQNSWCMTPKISDLRHLGIAPHHELVVRKAMSWDEFTVIGIPQKWANLESRDKCGELFKFKFTDSFILAIHNRLIWHIHPWKRSKIWWFYHWCHLQWPGCCAARDTMPLPWLHSSVR